MKKLKNKKQDNKKKRARETDDFDKIFENYKNKFVKKFESKIQKLNKDQNKDEHEELIMTK